MLTIRELTFDRIAPVAAELCAADMLELDAAGVSDARLMLADALPYCRWAQEALWGDESIAVFGVRPLPGGDVGVPWMLTTGHMDNAQTVAVAKAARRAVQRMQAEFSALTNWVHVRNERAIRFIEWLGFHVKPELCGPGYQFRQFTWSRACATP